MLIQSHQFIVHSSLLIRSSSQAPSPQIPTTPIANPTPLTKLLIPCTLRSLIISISTFSPLIPSTSTYPDSLPFPFRLGNREKPLYQYSTPWPPRNAASAVHSKYGCLPRAEASEYAVMSESEETEARVSIWRVERVWMVERAREALEAEGRRAREGRVMVVRLYETPYEARSVRCSTNDQGESTGRCDSLQCDRLVFVGKQIGHSR
jgi:hypothetical protein